MAKPGEETTLEECDENIRIHFRVVKKNGQQFYHHHYIEMDKSLDRRSELTRQKKKLYAHQS